MVLVILYALKNPVLECFFPLLSTKSCSFALYTSKFTFMTSGIPFGYNSCIHCIQYCQSRAECESSATGLWDRRCVIDSECPFFAEYGNKYRGGCENGYCMMPTGVQRVGYRKYIQGKESHVRKHANGVIAFPLDWSSNIDSHSKG